MICFFVDDKEIKKFNVFYDYEKLRKLKSKVINECSTLEHIETKSKQLLVTENITNFNIRNYTHVVIKNDDNEKLYLLKYDLYRFPYLVSIINKLLRDDISALEYVIYPNLNSDMKEEINENKKSIKKYYEILKEIIKLQFIDSIPLDYYYKVEKFFNVSDDFKIDLQENTIYLNKSLILKQYK